MPKRYVFQLNTTRLYEEAKVTYQIAMVAVEGLHGAARVQLDVTTRFDLQARTVAIDTSTATGEALAQVFTNLMIEEFGKDAFEVHHGNLAMGPSLPAVAAEA